MTNIQNRKSHARQKFLDLVPEQGKPLPGSPDRNKWINDICAGFVAPSEANKTYYRVILETLWPKGHGIPGPCITENQIREAIDKYRKEHHQGAKPYKPYIDVFRRFRELQGEEGIVGIGRKGERYQLVDLKISSKRIPRKHLNTPEWNHVLTRYGNQCAICDGNEKNNMFQQDHKVPRVRGGGDELANWQPLCDECNNFKSTSCRGCTLDCQNCSWAYPEKYKPFKISGQLVEKFRKYATEENIDPNVVVAELLEKYLEKKN